jgi:ABC-type Zn uptake system ZnuABC Zn-binding protein ZnuA
LKYGESKKAYDMSFNVRGNVDMALASWLKATTNAAIIFDNSYQGRGDFWGAASTLRPNWFAPLLPIDMMDPNVAYIQEYITNSNHLIDGKYLLGGTSADTTNPFSELLAAGYTKEKARRFMSDVAKAYPKLDVVEACEDVALLSEDDADSDHDHDHEADAESDSAHDHDHGDENAHAWMSVPRYRTMVQTIASRLAEKDAKHADEYYANAKAYDAKLAVLEEKINSIKSLTNGQNIIIFHEAYAYVADDFSMNACYLLDLDEERSVSAGEIKQVIGAIKDDGVSVILAEELYGKSMGDTVSRETDVHVIYIDPLNRGEYDKDSYLYGMEHNIELIKEAFTK